MPRVAVRFTGRVQGVGFRATTLSFAQRHELVGWVRNEPDGSVCAEMQGDAGQIDACLEAIDSAMGRLVSGVSRTEIESQNDSAFEIRF